MTEIKKNKGKVFEGYCIPCFSFTYPDIKIPRRYMLKELYIRDKLKEIYKEEALVCNKIVNDACSKKRPDIRIEKYTHTIIIEIDENEHKNYICENKRTMEIFQDLGNRPIVFIRFNPDKYDDIEGCFEQTETGIKLRRKEFNRRIKELVICINKHITTIPQKEVTTEHLFYTTTDR